MNTQDHSKTTQKPHMYGEPGMLTKGWDKDSAERAARLADQQRRNTQSAHAVAPKGKGKGK